MDLFQLVKNMITTKQQQTIRYVSQLKQATFSIAAVLLFSTNGIAATGDVTVIAGTGTTGLSGDGGLAINANIQTTGLALDNRGNIVFTDNTNHVVRRINLPSGIIETIAGTPFTAGYTGDGGLAINATFDAPSDIVSDAYGNLYVSDLYNQAIRKISNTTNIITTISGNGELGHNGTDNPVTASTAQLGLIAELEMDSSGRLIMVDAWSRRVMSIDFNQDILSVVSGGLSCCGPTGDGGPAQDARFYFPVGLDIDKQGNIYVMDFVYGPGAFRKIDASTGIIDSIELGWSSPTRAVDVDSTGVIFYALSDTIYSYDPSNALTSVVATPAPGAGVQDLEIDSYGNLIAPTSYPNARIFQIEGVAAPQTPPICN